jgi:hypothetical protein
MYTSINCDKHAYIHGYIHDYMHAYARFAPKFKYFEPKFEFAAGTAGPPVTPVWQLRPVRYFSTALGTNMFFFFH